MKTKTEIQKILIDKWLHKRNEVWNIEIIELEKIAEKENITLQERDLSKISDKLSWFIYFDKDNKKYTICVSSTDHIHRKRFTLAHEMWHYFLHPQILEKEDNGIFLEQNILFRAGDRSELEEEANLFAAEYLMPEEQVRELYKKYWVIEVLAWFFNVSNLAMAYRIDNLSSTLKN